MDNQFTEKELDLIREWFNVVQDFNLLYLEEKDYKLAEKIHGLLNKRTPNSIKEKINNDR